MHNALGLIIAAVMIASSAAGASAATRQPNHANHAGHGQAAHRPGTIVAVPYGARNAFGAVVAPNIGEGCSLRPFARDCDKRGPW